MSDAAYHKCLHMGPAVKNGGHLLDKVEAGDFMFAVASDGLPKIPFVYRTTKASIFARLITSGTKIELGRDGRSRVVQGEYTCEVISVRPLPPEAYAVARGLERKMRLGQFPDGFLLTKAEQRFLLKAEDFYLARPLSAADDTLKFPDEDAAPASLDLDEDAVE